MVVVKVGEMVGERGSEWVSEWREACGTHLLSR